MNIEDEAITEDEVTDNEDVNEGTIDDEEDEDDEGEIVVSIGDDDPDEDEDLTVEQEDDSDTIKKMRAAFKDKSEQGKERDARLKELEDKEAERQAAKDKIELRDKPKRDDYEYGQDDKYDDDLIAWNEDKKKHDAKKQSKEDEAKQFQTTYDDRLQGFNTRKKSIAVDDYDAVENKIKGYLSDEQQSIGVYTLNKPEMVFLALSRNSKELERISKITEPLILASELGKIEARLKTTKRKAPPPETRLKGTAAIGGASDKHLEKLERDSEKTGDRTKILKYKREQKELREAS